MDEIKFRSLNQLCRLFSSPLKKTVACQIRVNIYKLAMAKCSEGEENDFNRTVSLIGDGYKSPFILRRWGKLSNDRQ